MAISVVGFASAASTSVALPSFVIGDLAIVCTQDIGSNWTPPTLPAGWTTIIDNVGVYSVASRLAYRVLQAGDTTTGTWTNAENVGVIVLRGQHASPIGTSTAWQDWNPTIDYHGITLSVTDGSSAVLGACIARHSTVAIKSEAVSGMTNQSSGGGSGNVAMHTLLGATSFATKYYGIIGDYFASFTLEVKAATPAPGGTKPKIIGGKLTNGGILLGGALIR